MVTPVLETNKIRGFWSLRRLPSMGARGQGVKKPIVKIEKNVWDALEWDADHHHDHFEAPVHSRYYEKLPRVSVLRKEKEKQKCKEAEAWPFSLLKLLLSAVQVRTYDYHPPLVSFLRDL
ncbi:unnamed protein product [Triticum turgidum subsp. durum]|uniref:Uncharacterized protein n=1 Tax=Triticum turgidum subsp. durum TaxID=4567 RepID=A0A9R1RVQ7_TRITD|nr:unnamed protein product [Triticum turgidum subsp. durum]